MEIIIKGTPEEVAALVLELQGRLGTSEIEMNVNLDPQEIAEAIVDGHKRIGIIVNEAQAGPLLRIR